MTPFPWSEVARRTESALSAGALEPIPTRREMIEDGGVEFRVHQLDAIERKRTARRRQRGNPFLPYDPEMFVADISTSHAALLNKYNVLEQHLLIVTRRFEEQSAPLSPADFDAMGCVLDAMDGLGFYNGGTEAGASQPHKHLQLVPMRPVPMETAIVPVLNEDDPVVSGGLPFRHALAGVDGRDGRRSLECCRRLFGLLGLTEGEPYNLLVTRRWMMVVPRAKERFESISINALGFAGSFFVRNAAEFESLRRRGPLGVLHDVGL